MLLSFFNFNCIAYTIEKSTISTLCPSEYASTAPLNLILCDVWGLSFIFLVEGYHYIVIFVDYFTKFIYFYPMFVKS